LPIAGFTAKPPDENGLTEQGLIRLEAGTRSAAKKHPAAAGKDGLEGYMNCTCASLK